MKKINVIMNFGSREDTWQDCLRQAANIGFDGVEFGQKIGTEEASLLKELNLALVKTTVFPDESGAIDNADLLHSFGTKYTAINVPVRFGNHTQALTCAEKLNELGSIVGKYGFKIVYHNHTTEFRFMEGEYLLETVIRHTNPNTVCFCLDCGWAACAGVDVPALLRKYPGRFENLHLKACTEVLGPEAVCFMAPGPDGVERKPDPAEIPAIIGRAQSVNGPMKDSVVDWKEVLKAAEEGGCTTFIVERERAYQGTMLDCLKDDLKYFRSIDDSIREV